MNITITDGVAADKVTVPLTVNVVQDPTPPLPYLLPISPVNVVSGQSVGLKFSAYIPVGDTATFAYDSNTPGNGGRRVLLLQRDHRPNDSCGGEQFRRPDRVVGGRGQHDGLDGQLRLPVCAGVRDACRSADDHAGVARRARLDRRNGGDERRQA